LLGLPPAKSKRDRRSGNLKISRCQDGGRTTSARRALFVLVSTIFSLPVCAQSDNGKFSWASRPPVVTTLYALLRYKRSKGPSHSH